MFFHFAKKPKTIGLALGSGGPRGLAHIGVIKTLKKHHIPIHMIAGSSAGALIGGMYLGLGENIEKLESIVTSFKYTDMVKIFFDPTFSSGVIKSDKTMQFLDKYLDGIATESLPRPFTAVASDVVTGKPTLLKTGSLSKNIMASCSFPIIFSPIHLYGQYMIDGGTSVPVPAEVVREMGADIVIAVNLDAYFFPQTNPAIGKKPSVGTIAFSTISLLRYHLAKENAKTADIVIEPHISEFSPMKFVHGEPLIKEGERVAMEAIPHIMKLLE